MRRHRFYRELSSWYIDLPDYLAKGGSKGDLAMVAGADTMLDIVAGSANEVTLLIDEEAFAGADELVRTEVCEPSIGGAYYYMKSFEGNEVLQRMWLFAVT